MKKNELTEIKNLTIDQLVKKAVGLKKDIAGLVLDKNMRKLKDLKSVSKKKKDLARVLTFARQKQLLGEIEAKVKDIVKEEVVEKKERKVAKTKAKK